MVTIEIAGINGLGIAICQIINQTMKVYGQQYIGLIILFNIPYCMFKNQGDI